MFIVAILVLWFGGVSARLVHLQVTQHDWLKERASSQRVDVKRTRLMRGSIYDRHNRALAMSVRVKTLYADATRIEDVSGTAKLLAKSLGLKANELEGQLQTAKEAERKFVPIAKGLDEEAVQRINRELEDADLKKSDPPKRAGLHWREDQKRSYPHRTLAAHVVGFSNAEGVGQAGIEQSKNSELFGSVIKTVQERDRLGRVYDETVSEQEPPRNIVLTISNSIQYKVESALESAVKGSGSQSGMAVVIDHRTGEILALANYPTFDPNDLSGVSPENLTNNVIQSFYSPGSVFKLVTYGSALEKRLISPEAEIDTGNGTIEIARHKFKDSKPLGRITFTKALAVSSNVCAIKTGMRVGREGFYDMARKMGFGRPLGVSLPAETGGMLRSPDKWFGDSLASMSIGYEIGVSPLQMATAFATIANDGVRVQPHIVKEIRQSDDRVVSVSQPEKTRVVSVETAAALRKMLREVVVSGTGKMAQLNGYTSAGKTGTAWKYDPKLKRVSSAKYLSSFIGFAPAEDPRITIAVVMDEPRIGGRNGGQVAAPVFREIAEQVLPELKVESDSSELLTEIEPDEVDETIGNGEFPDGSIDETGGGSRKNPEPAPVERHRNADRPRRAASGPNEPNEDQKGKPKNKT
jgi:cell division protein FtsI (penicillin-binding protein 3)